jgi:hypothetical protein
MKCVLVIVGSLVAVSTCAEVNNQKHLAYMAVGAGTYAVVQNLCKTLGSNNSAPKARALVVVSGICVSYALMNISHGIIEADSITSGPVALFAKASTRISNFFQSVLPADAANSESAIEQAPTTEEDNQRLD